MNDRDLVERCRSEQKLSLQEVEALDAALREQEGIARAVKSLSEETVNLSWRSSLNERINGMAKPRVSLLARSWRPALGLGMACGLAAVLWIGQRPLPSATSAGPSVEAALIGEHVRSDQFTQLAGAGLSVHEAQPASIEHSDLDWDEVDLQVL